MTDDDFRAMAAQLDALVQEFETLPFPEIREMVFDLLHAVDAIHREALGRLASFLRHEGQSDLLERAAEEPIIRLLLLLYDLVPDEEPLVSGSATFIPLIQIAEVASPAPSSRYKEAAHRDDVPVGAMKAVEVDSVSILLFNVAGEVYAVRSQCPGSMAPLQLGSFSAPVLTCPWHNEAFDVRTGERVDGLSTPTLTPLPVAIDGEIIRVAVSRSSVVPGGASMRN